VAFAGIMLMLIGVFSVIAGLAAATGDGYIKATAVDQVFLVNYKILGFAWIVIGVIKVWTGWGLIQGREWARMVTILILFIDMITHLLALTSQPFLSLLFITVDMVILYGVTVRWDVAKIGMGD